MDDNEKNEKPVLSLEFTFDSDEWPVQYLLIESEVMFTREMLSAFLMDFAEGLESGEYGLEHTPDDVQVH